MKMLAALPDERYTLPITDDDVEMAAFCDDAGNVYIMLYAQNFTGNCGEYSAVISLKNAPVFSDVSVEKVGKGSGDPFPIWEEMGNLQFFQLRKQKELSKIRSHLKATLMQKKSIPKKKCRGKTCR